MYSVYSETTRLTQKTSFNLLYSLVMWVLRWWFCGSLQQFYFLAALLTQSSQCGLELGHPADISTYRTFPPCPLRHNIWCCLLLIYQLNVTPFETVVRCLSNNDCYLELEICGWFEYSAIFPQLSWWFVCYFLSLWKIALFDLWQGKQYCSYQQWCWWTENRRHTVD